MEDYTKIIIPKKFRTISSVYPDFHKPIGIVTESDLEEAKEETGVKWLVLPKDIEVSDFVNNRSNKIIFFTSTYSVLVNELKHERYIVSVDGEITIEAPPEVTPGRCVVKRTGFDSDFYRKHSPLNAIWEDGKFSKHPDLNQLMNSVFNKKRFPKLMGNPTFSHNWTSKNLTNTHNEVK